MTSDPYRLRRFNALPAARAERALRECCAAPGWAAAVAAARPFTDHTALTDAADHAYARLTWPDIRVAVDAHPRIGDRPAGQDRESRWSRAEQAGAHDAGQPVRDALRDGTRAYEERFGHVFLVCATGLSAEDMLTALRTRLASTPADERRVVREELRKIIHIRLAKLLEQQ